MCKHKNWLFIKAKYKYGVDVYSKYVDGDQEFDWIGTTDQNPTCTPKKLYVNMEQLKKIAPKKLIKKFTNEGALKEFN